jgi:WD40 repeat protein
VGLENREINSNHKGISLRSSFLTSMQGHTGAISAVQFSSVDSHIASASVTGEVFLSSQMTKTIVAKYHIDPKDQIVEVELNQK